MKKLPSLSERIALLTPIRNLKMARSAHAYVRGSAINFYEWLNRGPKSFVMRELLPQDVKLDLEALSRDEAASIARYLASVVGAAHGRQMDNAMKRLWLGELKRNRPKKLDAPSWLWSCVTELIASHEVAYLDHCRRHALAAA